MANGRHHIRFTRTKIPPKKKSWGLTIIETVVGIRIEGVAVGPSRSRMTWAAIFFCNLWNTYLVTQETPWMAGFVFILFIDWPSIDDTREGKRLEPRPVTFQSMQPRHPCQKRGTRYTWTRRRMLFQSLTLSFKWISRACNHWVDEVYVLLLTLSELCFESEKREVALVKVDHALLCCHFQRTKKKTPQKMRKWPQPHTVDNSRPAFLLYKLPFSSCFSPLL